MPQLMSQALALSLLTGAMVFGCKARNDQAPAASAVRDAAPSTPGYPAFADQIATNMPTLVMGAGSVLQNAHIVVITYPTDGSASADSPANVAAIEAFVSALSNSAYWSQATSEYGIGAFSKIDYVHLTADDLPKATYANTKDDSGNFVRTLGVLDASPNGGAGSVSSFVGQHAADPDSGWPAPDNNTVYVVFVPASVNLVSRASATVGELNRIKACDSFLGYHSERASHGRQGQVLWTIVSEGCNPSTIESTEAITSHELAEVVTDPFFMDDATTALSGFDPGHLAWTIFDEDQTEIGDACEFYPESNLKDPAGLKGYTAQNLWSNNASRAGHDPCVPSDGSAFFTVVPLNPQPIAVVVPPQTKNTTSTMGYQVPKNRKSASFNVGFFSDAPMPGPWTLTAYVGGTVNSMIVENPQPSAEQRLTVTFGDNNATSVTGTNGTTMKVNIAVDRNAQAEHGSTRNGIVVTLISSYQGMNSHYMPIMIGI